MSSSTVNKQKRGRPPGGHNGKRVHDYPALLVRLRRHIEEILAAVAEVTNLSRTRVIFRALVMSKLKYLRDHQPLWKSDWMQLSKPGATLRQHALTPRKTYEASVGTRRPLHIVQNQTGLRYCS